MFKSIFLPLIAVAAFISLVGLLMQGKIGNFNPANNLRQQAVQEEYTDDLDTIIIKGAQINVEIAWSDQERSKGLSGRTILDQDSGMLFVFDPPAQPNFWMKNTLIPLDMIWIKDNKIVGITKNVQPEPNVADSQLQVYPAPTLVDYVLEVNGGYADVHNFAVGDIVDLSQI